MNIYKNLIIDKKYKNSVVAIGNFDGIHLGHRKIIREGQLKAKKEKIKFGILTFEPVPVMFFNKKIKNHRINNLNQKIKYLKELKIDFLNIIQFTKNFSNLKSDKFIKKILYDHLRCKFIYISKNFKFGKNREGDIYKLKKKEKFFLFKTKIVKPLKKNKKVLSSSIIRNEITKGNFKKVNRILGRSWSIQGKVIQGEKRGRKIGFPTCNISVDNYIIPKLGVYSVSIEIGKVKKKGIANIGYRPTFKGKKLLLEVNIFDLKANLYNKIITVNFDKFIREEKKFKNIEELKVQIKKDIAKAKK